MQYAENSTTISNPGRIPAMNSCEIDVPDTTP
jgi:hypothetical protein